MSDNQDFDAIIKAEFVNDEVETPSLAAAVDALMAANAELTARVAFYEEQGQKARHAFRALKKAKTQSQAKEAHDVLRDKLRSIHPTTVLGDKA